MGSGITQETASAPAPTTPERRPTRRQPVPAKATRPHHSYWPRQDEDRTRRSPCEPERRLHLGRHDSRRSQASSRTEPSRIKSPRSIGNSAENILKAKLPPSCTRTRRDHEARDCGLG